jgi:propanediol dehydratase large subunit
MPLSGLRLGDISAGALSSLIDNGVRETRRIDYKLIVGTDHLSSWQSSRLKWCNAFARRSDG